MDNFAKAYRWLADGHAVVHVIPDRDEPRGRALCGYRPRAPWDIRGPMNTFTPVPLCAACFATHERLKRRTDVVLSGLGR